MESAKNHYFNRGLVFNIQRFSLHDGPGIRTTVFMKGCPLRCRWCSNPESQDIFPNLMVRDIQCKGCGACVKVCTKGAIKISKKGIRDINWKKCDQCLLCVDACIYNSLNTCGDYMGIQEVVDEVMRDEAFYNNSGGGVTVSGGEPLLQIEFVSQLLKSFKEKGLHTAIDTSGYVAWSKIEKALPFIDLALWDIKHLDPREHERATGVGNKLILENLERASGVINIWLRLPLITGFNDSEEYIRSVAILGKKVGAEKLSLLPYYDGGRSKSEQIGRSYQFSKAEVPTDEHINVLRETIEREGVKVSLGN